jgi:hypothetical protein
LVALFTVVAAYGTEIVPQITREISSDVPIADVTIGGEDASGIVSIHESGGPSGFGLQWSVYLVYGMSALCAPPNSIYYCSEYWADQTGGNYTDFRHRTSVTYTWTIPLVVPGTGYVYAKEGATYGSDHTEHMSPGSLRKSAGIVLPTVIARGKEFNAVVSLRIEGVSILDFDRFGGAVLQEMDLVPVTATPEASSCWLLGSGLAALSMRSRRLRRLFTSNPLPR